MDNPFKKNINNNEIISQTEKLINQRQEVLNPGAKIEDIDKQIKATPDQKDKERFDDTKIRKTNFVQSLLNMFLKRDNKQKPTDAKKRLPGAIIPNRFDGMSIQDIIAPVDLEVDFNYVQIGDRYYRVFFVNQYPRFVGPNWLSPIINFEYSINISTFYYPVDSKEILEKLKRKIGEMEATLYTQMEQRKVIDPSIKVTLTDAQQLQDSIAEGTEKFFHFAMYITISATSLELLEKISKNVVSTLAAINVTAKSATLQQEHGLHSCQPLGIDKLYITRNMDTTSLATTFPFVTSELTMDHGIMYGINQHNNSLVIFDRFDMQNANTVVFATSGAGKSYFVKLEALRSLMLGTEIIVIDPDKEYQALCKAVDGAYISFSQDKGDKINPFELSGLGDPNDDELRMKILSLEGFFRLLLGDVTPVEISIIDRALLLTYREKGITLDPATQRNITPPLLEDMYKVLKGMAESEAQDIARRLERYIIGSGAGIFNEKSTVTFKNPFTVFSIRDLQEELRPMAMYLMLDYIWTKVRNDVKRRILVVDEAWYMMQNQDSAKFLYSIAKRARKYYLGLTTITQDVDDFLKNELGKAIINNSSIQFLMKQSPNAVEKVGKVFNLSEGEKAYLMSCDKGQGLFFAGANHVAIQVVSSKSENDLITSDPKDLERLKQQTQSTATAADIQQMAEIYEPPAIQKPIKEGVDIDSRQIIQKAMSQRKQDIVELMQEKLAYQQQQDAQNAASITDTVSNERKTLQQNLSHLTPQGVIDSFDKSDDGNNQ